MIAYLLASYGGIDSIMLKDYLYQSCLHEIGHMVDALKIFDGSNDNDANTFMEYYRSLDDDYLKYNEWLKEQDPETMTTARGRMEYFKIPFEQRANEYGHVDTDLMFEILKRL